MEQRDNVTQRSAVYLVVCSPAIGEMMSLVQGKEATERFLSDNNAALKIFPKLNFLDPITYHY